MANVRADLYTDAASRVTDVVESLATASDRDPALLASMSDLAGRLTALSVARNADSVDVHEVQSLMVEVADLVLALESVRLSAGVGDAEKELMLSLLYVLQDCVHMIGDDEIWEA